MCDSESCVEDVLCCVFLEPLNGMQVTNVCFMWFNPELQSQQQHVHVCIFSLHIWASVYTIHLQVHRILMRTQYGEKRNQIGMSI